MVGWPCGLCMVAGAAWASGSSMPASQPVCAPLSPCPHPPPRPSEANTSLVEGCFCPEGTTSYAPGYDVCVELCGTLPAHTAPPKPTPVLRHQDSANRTAFLSLPRLCGT